MRRHLSQYWHPISCFFWYVFLEQGFVQGIAHKQVEYWRESHQGINAERGGGSISSTLDTALEQQLGRVTAQMGKSSLKTCAADNWAARYPRRNP